MVSRGLGFRSIWTSTLAVAHLDLQHTLTVRQRLFWSQRSRRLPLWLRRSASLSLLLSPSLSNRSRQVAADCGAAGGFCRNESCPCRCPPPPPDIAGNATPRRAAAAFAAAIACAQPMQRQGCVLYSLQILKILRSELYCGDTGQWQGGGHASWIAAESLLVTTGALKPGSCL